MTKALGFNCARKHVKVEDPRWYYWCDRLGLAVWQDMPSSHNLRSEEAKENFRRELTEMLGIEEIVGPSNLVAGIVEQAIRTGGGGWMNQGQLHNCCARSRQSVKSAAVAPATK